MGQEGKGVKRKKMNCCSGIHLTRSKSFAELLDTLDSENLIYLVENGELIDTNNLPCYFQPLPPSKPPLIILGDDIGIDGAKSTIQDLENVFEERGVHRHSLGSTSLLASHCIIMLHYILDSQKK
jgi:tRNA pseudouridine-54 N-methylase